MTLFVALCGLLVAAALALLVLPLLARRDSGTAARSEAASNAAVYGDQLAEIDAELRAGALSREQWSAARGEIERRALDEFSQRKAVRPESRSKAAAAFIGVALPVAAIALYLVLGNPGGLSPGSHFDRQITAAQIETMVARLAARLEQNPGDIEGWIMLGRSYAVLGKFPEAAAAYAKAAKERPRDAQLLADYAEVLAELRGGRLAGAPEALVVRALEIDGDNTKALALSGIAAYERRDFRAAAAAWRKMLGLIPGDSEFAQSVRASIENAEQELRLSGAKKSPARVAGADAAKGRGASLQGTVSLVPAAAAKARPEDVVFVFARAAEGPRMPLAVLRRQVKDLPFEFSLDDSMAMDPSLRLSSFGKVVVVARISRSGAPTPQKGDLEGVTAPLAPGAKSVRLKIDRVIE